MATTRPFPSSNAALGAAGLCLLLAACGGGGGGDTAAPSGGGTPAAPSVGGPTAIDSAAMTKAIPEISLAIPICRQASADGGPALKSTPRAESAWLARLTSLRELSGGRSLPATKALGPTKPADVLGNCGGRRGYTAYSHSGGVTTGTLAFENYCSSDADTGQRQVISGSIDFVNTGTPSANGPITSRVEAGSPGGLTLRRQDATGRALDSQSASFTNFVYAVGVPGGSPTATRPDVMRVGEIRYTNAAGQTYRQTDYVTTTWETAGGGEQMTISGRGYRSNGDYFDVSTPTPVTSDASGKTTAGEIAIAGANGSRAVMTMVPGSRLQATMTVNGSPVTSVPACQ
jgi:hypothetical protein